MQSYAARLFGNTFLNFVSISAFKEAIGQYVCDNTIFLKWGIVNVPFCSIFVPFHFYLIIIMTLVVPCLDNIFMVLLICALAKIGATKPTFLDSGSPRGGGGCACVGMVCYHFIVHILNSSKNPYFL